MNTKKMRPSLPTCIMFRNYRSYIYLTLNAGQDYQNVRDTYAVILEIKVAWFPIKCPSVFVYFLWSVHILFSTSGWKHVLISIRPKGCEKTGPKKCVHTGPVGCINTMVSQHRSGRVWKNHKYFDEKKLEKSILTKQHLWTSKLQPIIC